MVDFPGDDNRKNLTTPLNLNAILDAFRDSYHTLKYNGNDPVGAFIMEMQGMKMTERKSRGKFALILIKNISSGIIILYSTELFCASLTLVSKV